jgi:hypothetical protein
VTKSRVAVVTQQTAHLPGVVVVIDMPVVICAGAIATADCAGFALIREHRVIFIGRDAVLLAAVV